MDASEDVGERLRSDAAMALALQGAECASVLATAQRNRPSRSAESIAPIIPATRARSVGLEGLFNVGDFCYVNAVLAPLLRRVEGFVPLDPGVCAAYLAVRAAVDPEAQIEALRELRATFAEAGQEDAADLCRFLVAGSPLFESSVESTFSCTECGQVTTTTRESAWTLRIHPAGVGDTLQECLRRMSRREEVDFGIAHACSRCRSLRRTEDSSIPTVGDYLLIEIVPDEIVPGLGRAVEEEELSFPPFSFPPFLRDREVFPLAPPDAAHELIAVVYYVTEGGPLISGSESRGHYVCAVLDEDGMWKRHDDDMTPEPIDPAAEFAVGLVRVLLYGPRALPTAGLAESARHVEDSCTAASGAAGAPESTLEGLLEQMAKFGLGPAHAPLNARRGMARRAHGASRRWARLGRISTEASVDGGASGYGSDPRAETPAIPGNVSSRRAGRHDSKFGARRAG